MINSHKVTSSNESAIKGRTQHTQMSSTQWAFGEQVLLLVMILDLVMDQACMRAGEKYMECFQ